MTFAWTRSLWTHVVAPAVAFFLGLSVGPVWLGDLGYAYHVDDCFEPMPLWRALATIPRNVQDDGIGTACAIFWRNNWIVTAVLLGFAAVCVFMDTAVMYWRTVGREETRPSPRQRVV